MIELSDLSKTPLPTADATEARNDDNDGDAAEDPDAIYAIPSVLLLFVSAIFLAFPGFVLYLASTPELSTTPLERFLLTQLGIYFAVVGISLLLRTTRHPLLIPLTAGSSLSAFVSYNATSVGSLATLFFLSQTTLSLWGFYSLLFANEPLDLHRSKTTGADKRTSAFIFGNKAAASSQKNEWRKKERGEAR